MPRRPQGQPPAPDAPKKDRSHDEGPTTVYSLSEEETFDLGRAMALELEGGELVLLQGELGMGKTVFARGLAVGLGIAAEDVTSPSYTLVQEYSGGRLPLFHVDLYRVEDHAEQETIGLEEILAARAVVVVEWGEKLLPAQRRGALVVAFHDLGEGSRRIELRIPGPRVSGQRRGDA